MRGCQGVLGAGRECRYSGARRYMWHKGDLGDPRGCWEPLGGCQGSIGDGRKCRYSGARRYMWHKREMGWLLGGVGVSEGC